MLMSKRRGCISIHIKKVTTSTKKRESMPHFQDKMPCRLSQGRSENCNFLIWQKFKSVPQNQGCLHFVLCLVNGVDPKKFVF